MVAIVVVAVVVVMILAGEWRALGSHQREHLDQPNPTRTTNERIRLNSLKDLPNLCEKDV